MASTTATMNRVMIGSSRATNTDQAVADLARQIAQPDTELVLFFSSVQHQPEVLARAMADRFPGNTVGCTTAGEIGPAGYARQSIVAMSLGPGPIHVHPYPMESVSALDLQAVTAARRRFDQDRVYPEFDLVEDCFGMLLIDGLCLKEEHIVASLYRHFQPMPIVGGSAGDDLQYERTSVFTDGRALDNAGVFLVFEMGGVPFQTFRLQDFAPISDYMVITAADGEMRLIREIDGEPATHVYARLVGVPPEQMTRELFASHSLLVQIGGEEYIRSVRSLGPDGSLFLHSAIDEGVVVRLGRSDDTMVSLNRFLPPGSDRISATSLLVSFDCMHRRIELTRQGSLDRAGGLLGQMPTIGFSTYGEVVDSIHVNQTMTGVAFGWRDGSREAR
jgi:hypothetical protein